MECAKMKSLQKLVKPNPFSQSAVTMVVIPLSLQVVPPEGLTC